MERVRARVARFGTRGFGFASVGGRDVFIHMKAFKPPRSGELEPGTMVEFSIVENERGPVAVNVKVIDNE